MWKLQNTKKEHCEQYVFVEEECIVGRKEATLLIANDPSVSRKHAVLFVRHPEENIGNASRNSSLFMRDESSKYGTFKNGVRITKEEELTDGDIVKFGQFESEFRVYHIPLIVTTSCLDVASKNKLKKVIHQLGGHIVSEWQPSCTHLVMSQVKVTIKALCCLVSLKSIVLPDYFDDLQRKLKSSATIVPPNEYIPPIGESLIDKDVVSFDVNPQRKTLFQNKNFFFMDEKQFKKLHFGIVLGGGNTLIVSSSMDPDTLLNENTCFIEPVKRQDLNEESEVFLKKIITALQNKNLRMIPESDIGLAVAYSSTETFCNPAFSVGSAVLGSQKLPSQTLSEREVYAPDTEEKILRASTSKRISFLDLPNQPKNKRPKFEEPDSLNLTSCREEAPEETFEVPLSPQVKKELEDIFEKTMRQAYGDVNNEIEELPATLLVEPQFEISHITEKHKRETSLSNKEPLRVPKVEPNTSFVHQNGNRTVPASPKRPKAETSTTLVNGNGFHHLNMTNGGSEENLPRNLLKIEFADLIVRTYRGPAVESNTNTTVKNFKKFKKVYPIKAQALPRIIGGHDLVPYDAANLSQHFNDEEGEAMNKKPVKGAFDW